MILNWLKNHKTEVWIFVLAFGVRFLYAIFIQLKFGSHGFLAYSDAFSFYLPLAKNIVENHIFSMSSAPPYLPDAYRTPLYPLFLAAFLWLKLPLFFAIFAQNLFAGAFAVLTYRIGIILFDSRNIGLSAAVLVALEPMSVYWNNLLMSDWLYSLLFLLGFYFFILKRYYWFSFSLGLAALDRSIGAYFFPFFLAIMIWEKISWKKIILAVLIFFAVLSPWALRNKIIFNSWELSSASWYNLYGVVAQMFADKEGFILPKPNLPPYNPANTAFYKEHFFEVLKTRPLQYTRFHLSLVFTSLFKNPYRYLAEDVLRPKAGGFFNGPSGALIRLAALFGGIFWCAIYLFSFIGLFGKKYCIWSLLVSAAFIFNALSLGALGLGADMSRYMLPFQPLMFLFAGAGLKNLYRKLA